MTFFTFGISSDPCSSMFQMYLGSVISSCCSTFSYFLYQANTELFLVALAHAMDRFVTVSLTFNWGYLFKRKPNHFLPASLCTLLKPSNPLASAKENAIFLTSLPLKEKPKNEYSCIILTISSENKELTCYRGCTWFSLKSTLQAGPVIQFSLPSCSLGRTLLFPLPPDQCS